MNEWEFTSNVAGWINESIRRSSGLRVSEARCEQKSKGSQKRRDITLMDKDGRIVLTGEVKLPYQKDGNTPLNHAVISDARAKARLAGVNYFFTWNVNDFVLWPTQSPEGAWEDRKYKSWQVTKVRNEEDLGRPGIEHAVRKWIDSFLPEFSQIVAGQVEIGHKAPDEKFIEMLGMFLETPINLTFNELSERYQTIRFKKDLDQWMTQEQNWVVVDDENGIRDNLERASKFACYSLVNKLVFHEALLKRYGTQIDKLSVPAHITTGEDLRKRLESYFAKAKIVTGDYETVFGEDHTTIGNRIPFYSDHAVSHWRDLISEIHQYDFTELQHDVIGTIFEHLLGEEERKKYGQFYTRAEVVDLINSFCIRNGDEKVMDPACGSGTFLVRAYGRKSELAPSRTHTELLTDIYGVDIARYATEWTTINLATRDLVEEENYPRVVRNDFFDVAPHATVMSLPKHAKTAGLGKAQHQNILIPELDAIIGNLPYIRQEQIKNKKADYQSLAKTEGKIAFSGRSDLHCYFWPHATTFLKESGYIGFLTSSQWLDVEYGFRLQEWMLRNFQIIAILESIDEPWFVGARVATTVTILKRQSDEQVRMNNVVRFIQLRQPVRDLFSYDGSMAGSIRVMDEFRDEILALDKSEVNDRYRARVVRQSELWEQGVRLGHVMKKSDADDEDENSAGEYYGGKWGVYLRAPDLWFDLLKDYSKHLVPLGEIAEIWRGITSGNDAFFFPKDCSQECLQKQPNAKEFEIEYGVPRREIASGKVKLVRCGEGRGEIRPIEAEYLEPEVHTLIKWSGFSISASDCDRMILLSDSKKNRLVGKYIRSYISWGEDKGINKKTTCASRATSGKEWYDLTGHKRGDLLWPMTQKYKHAVPVNADKLICNHRLFDISGKEIAPLLLAGILNSSLTILSKMNYGRFIGTEGTLDTEVIDVRMMLVPDPRHASKDALKRVSDAFNELDKRKALQFLSEKRLRRAAFESSGKREEWEQLSDVSELDLPDRRQLDDAVLELMGVVSKAQRDRIIEELYLSLRELFERNKQIEEKSNLNKIISHRKSATRPEDLAAQIYEALSNNTPEYLRVYERDFLDASKPCDTYELPTDGEPRYEADMISNSELAFIKGKGKRIDRIVTRSAAQAELLAIIAGSGLRGFVRVPLDDKECGKVHNEYEAFVADREHLVLELINDRTADEDLQEKIFDALMPMLLRAK